MRKHELKEDAFTGLEAAIVLIAFVVVAAVFSYVVLGAGFFTTQKSQETIYSGVSQSTSNIEVVGPVSIQTDASDEEKVALLMFKIKTAAGGSEMDLSKMTYTVSTKDDVINYVYDDVTLQPIGDFTIDDKLLKPGEIMEVVIGTNDEYTGKVALPAVGLSEVFSIEIKPSVGAPLLLQKTSPAGMTVGGFYELY